MRYYQLNVPVDVGAADQLRGLLLNIAGGYTELPFTANGGWVDGEGRVAVEHRNIFQVAASVSQMQRILRALHELYPQEKSWLIVNMGEATFWKPKAPIASAPEATSNAS